MAKYAINLTNIFQDSYNYQHKDGFLKESDINDGGNPHVTALFDSQESAQAAIESLKNKFFDSPDLDTIITPF